MKRSVIAPLFALLFAAAAFGQSSALAKAQRVTGDRFTVSLTTPKGARVIAVGRPSAAMLNAIDSGLTELFAAARRSGYRRMLSHGNYTIFVAKADRQMNGGTYSPDIAVGAAQYAGSDYDQGGFIYAAGMVISNSPASFVIAEHTRDLGRVSNVVRYEGEHLVLYHNDRRKYMQTRDHSSGGGHPIL